MSSPLSSDRNRDAIPPRAGNSDPRSARRVDVLDELQRALDATRIAAISEPAPPLQPGPGKDGAPEAEKAPLPPLHSAYIPPKARRAYAAQSGAAQQSPRPVPTAAPDLPDTPLAPEKLGAISARVSSAQLREQRAFAENPAPEFLRNARPHSRPTHSGHAPAVARLPLHGVHENPSTGFGEYSDHDDEVLRRILQPQRPAAPRAKPRKQGWAKLVGFSALASLIVCSAGFLGYQFFFVTQAPAESTAGNTPRAALVSSSFAKSGDRVADKNAPKEETNTPTGAKAVKTTMISASQDVFPPPKAPGMAPQTNGSRPSSFDDPQRGDITPGPRQLDPEEVRNLIQRGDAALQRGDIAAARLLLRRAAESGDVTAAMALGATYDPGVLSQLGAMGAKGDVGTARDWYQKAADAGSPDAKRRLQELAQQ